MPITVRVAALLSVLSGAALAVPPTPDPQPESVPAVPLSQQFDPARSQASFTVRLRILRPAVGHFLDVRGELEADGARQRVAVEVDGHQLRVDGPAWMDKVTRSDDFLDLERHPNIRFRSAPFAPALLRKGGMLRGELTLRGLARDVAFELAPSSCEAPGRDCEIVVTGKVNRRAFGMTAYRFSVKDQVDFEFRVRLAP
jgi:polyisoprenoid-binding protein YceI